MSIYKTSVQTDKRNFLNKPTGVKYDPIKANDLGTNNKEDAEEAKLSFPN